MTITIHLIEDFILMGTAKEVSLQISTMRGEGRLNELVTGLSEQLAELSG